MAGGAVDRVAPPLPFHRALLPGALPSSELRAALLAPLSRPAGLDPAQGAAHPDGPLRDLAARRHPRLRARDRRDGRRRRRARRALAVRPAVSARGRARDGARHRDEAEGSRVGLARVSLIAGAIAALAMALLVGIGSGLFVDVLWFR